MTYDRITQIRITGLRVIDEIKLDLNGLTVLIGDNGTGKSSILEALELLRQAAKPVDYVQDILGAHGGFNAMLRHGAAELRLGVTIEGAGPALDYDFSIGIVRTIPLVKDEQVGVHLDPPPFEPFRALVRKGPVAKTFDVPVDRSRANVPATQSDGGEEMPVDERWLAISWLGSHPGGALGSPFQRVARALEGIEVHVPFETRPVWQQRELEMRAGLGPRWASMVERSDALARYGVNLPNAYQQLRNLGDDVWSRVLERVRLGLGDDFRNLRLPPVGRGSIELEVVRGSAPDKPIPAEALSEGQLAYLAFVALVELHARRSLLAFDEPELHLHPALLARVVWMIEEVAERVPVLLSTHSDRLLDTLADPTRSAALCELDERGATTLRRPDPKRLAEWLESYRGLGSIRAEGYEDHVFEPSRGGERGT